MKEGVYVHNTLSPELILLNQGITHKDIASSYDEAFENGFNVTSKEIMDLLQVSSQWVPRHITHVKFCVINLVGKQALRKHGRANYKHLHRYNKVFHRDSFNGELLRNSFIEDEHGLHSAKKIPQNLISCAGACYKYQIDRKTFYRRAQKAKKYIIFGLKRYSAREIEHILLDSF
ncbi:hypothetical protein HCB29_16135 [Listeria booriae]|nr:hypothetical protein [Listeria booriae]